MIPESTVSDQPPQLTSEKDAIPEHPEQQEPPILQPETPYAVEEQYILDGQAMPPPLLPPRRVTRSSSGIRAFQVNRFLFLKI